MCAGLLRQGLLMVGLVAGDFGKQPNGDVDWISWPLALHRRFIFVPRGLFEVWVWRSYLMPGRVLFPAAVNLALYLAGTGLVGAAVDQAVDLGHQIGDMRIRIFLVVAYEHIHVLLPDRLPKLRQSFGEGRVRHNLVDGGAVRRVAVEQ